MVRPTLIFCGFSLAVAGCGGAPSTAPPPPMSEPAVAPGGSSPSPSDPLPSAVPPPSAVPSPRTDAEPPFDPSPYDPKLAPLEAGVVLRWSFEHALNGAELVEIRDSGAARVEVLDPDGRRRSASYRLAPGELEALAATLRSVEPCGWRSRRRGIPDEVRPTLRIRLGGLACDVVLWDGEWSEQPGSGRATEWVRKGLAQLKGP